MKRLVASSLLLLVFFLAACSSTNPVPVNQNDSPVLETQANFFRRFGSSVNSSATFIYSNHIQLDNDSNPVVAWIEGSSLLVKRWNGSTWIQLGTQVNQANSTVLQLSMVLDSAGSPIVAWSEWAGGARTLFIKRWNGTSWVQLGAALNILSNHDAEYPSLALDSHDQIYVSWSEISERWTDIFVKRWTGTTWRQVGGAVKINSLENALTPSLAIDSTGVPVIAWVESLNIYVARWDGIGWLQQGDRLNTSIAYTPKLVLESSGTAVVAYSQFENGSFDTYVKRWNGTGWSQLGSALDTTLANFALNVDLLLDSSNRPVVSWNEQVSSSPLNRNIYVKRWNGSSWQSIGSAWDINASKDAAYPSLALDASGNPVLSWAETIDASIPSMNVYVTGYFSNTFRPLGSSLDKTATNDANDSVIALDTNNLPIVAWTEMGTSTDNDINVARWTGRAWSRIAQSPDNTLTNSASSPSLAVDRATNNPVIAFTETVSGNPNLYVKRWDGTAWVHYGSSIPLDIISSNSVNSPSLALDNQNFPWVAWTEWQNGKSLLYVKRWNGSAWVRPGGISPLNMEAFPAARPSLAIRNNQVFIAWQEGVLSDGNIYVKQLSNGSWQALGVDPIDYQMTSNAGKPSLAISSTNLPIVAFEEISNGVPTIYTRYWNGSQWLTYGRSLGFSFLPFRFPNAFTPSLALGSANEVLLSYSQIVNGSSNIYVSKLGSKGFARVGTAALDINLSQGAFEPSLAVTSTGLPIVSWTEVFPGQNNNIYVKGF